MYKSEFVDIKAEGYFLLTVKDIFLYEKNFYTFSKYRIEMPQMAF